MPPQAPKKVAELSEAEQTICDAPAAEFFDIATALIDRYDHPAATKNAAKKLGYTGIPKDCASRVEMFRAIVEYAESRDAEESGTLPLDIEDSTPSGAYAEA